MDYRKFEYYTFEGQQLRCFKDEKTDNFAFHSKFDMVQKNKKKKNEVQGNVIHIFAN